MEAVSSYNDALRIDPFFVEAYNGRGNALMDFGHEDGTVLGRSVQVIELVSFSIYTKEQKKEQTNERAYARTDERTNE